MTVTRPASSNKAMWRQIYVPVNYESKMIFIITSMSKRKINVKRQPYLTVPISLLSDWYAVNVSTQTPYLRNLCHPWSLCSSHCFLRPDAKSSWRLSWYGDRWLLLAYDPSASSCWSSRWGWRNAECPTWSTWKTRVHNYGARRTNKIILGKHTQNQIS